MFNKFKNLKRNAVVLVSALAAAGYASADSILGNVDFSGVSSEVKTVAAAMAAVFVVIAGARIAIGFIKRA